MPNKATVESVREAIAALPVDFREVVVLRELEGLSYKETSEVSGVPLGGAGACPASAFPDIVGSKAARPTMNCRECYGYIDASIDNELDIASTILVKQHCVPTSNVSAARFQ